MERKKCMTIRLLAAFFMLMTPAASFAADYYWRAYPTNNNFNSTANWVTNPADIYLQGESVPSTPGTLPGAGDNVFFTAPSTHTNLKVPANASFNNLTVTAVDGGDPALSADFVFDRFNTFTLTGSIQSNGNLNFTSLYSRFSMTGGADAVIDFGPGIELAALNVVINKPGARVELKNDIVVAGGFSPKFILTNCGSFKSNGYDISFPSEIEFAAESPGSREIDLAASTLTSASVKLAGNNEPGCSIILKSSNAMSGNPCAQLTNTTIKSAVWMDIAHGIADNNVARCLTSKNSFIGTVDINMPTGFTLASPGVFTVELSGSNTFGSFNAYVKNISFKSMTTGTAPLAITDLSLRVDQCILAGNLTAITVADKLTLEKSLDMKIANGVLSFGNLVKKNHDCSNKSFFYGNKPLDETTAYNKITTTGTAPVDMEYITVKGLRFEAPSGPGFISTEAYNAGFNEGSIAFAPAAAADYYWIGGTGSWDDPAHWSLSSGGVSAGCIPSASDNVYFDDRSFTAAGETVTLTTTTSFHNISWRMTSGKKGWLIGGGYSLMIGGSLDFSGMEELDLYAFLHFLGVEKNTPVEYTINTGGVTLRHDAYLYPEEANTYKLAGDWKQYRGGIFTDKITRLYHYRGTFSSEGYLIETTFFYSDKPVPEGASRRLYLTGGTEIRATQMVLNQNGMAAYDFMGSHIRFIVSTSSAGLKVTGGVFNFDEVTTEGVGSSSYYSGYIEASLKGGTEYDTFKTINLQASKSTIINKGLIVDDLVLTKNTTWSSEISNSSNVAQTLVTVRNSISGLGACDAITVQGQTAAKRLVIRNESSAPLAIPSASMQYVTYESADSGEGPMLVEGGEELSAGSTVNITFTDRAARDFYWVGGAGSWSDPLHWSFTSGGAPNAGGCIPSKTDDVYFDNNSFLENTEEGRKVVMDLPGINIHSMYALESAAVKPYFITTTGNVEIHLSGSVELAQGTQKNIASGLLIFYMAGSGQQQGDQNIKIPSSLSSNNFYVTIEGSGRFDLSADLSLRYFSFMNTPGNSLYTHGYAVSTEGNGSININQSASSVVDMSNSVLRTGGSQNINLTVENCQQFRHDNAQLLSNNSLRVTTSDACGLSFRKITAQNLNASGPGTIYADTIASVVVNRNPYNLTVNTDGYTAGYVLVQKDLYVSSGSTFTINKDIQFTGNPCTYRIISGSSAAQPGILKFNYCNPEAAFIEIQYITAQTLPAGSCNDAAQTFTIYGQDHGGGGNTNVAIKNPLNTGENTLDKMIVSCVPSELDFAKSDAVSYQWYRGGRSEANKIPAGEGGTARRLLVEEAGSYTLDVMYADKCESLIHGEVEFDADRTWTALGEKNNWNDPENWNPKSVPDHCSYVTIPGGLSHYPVIKAADAAACSIIDFKFGGEAKNTHWLTYTEAKVELGLISNQWHMLSPPLKEMYSGDFYMSSPNPYEDFDQGGGTKGMMVYTQKFNIVNPELGGTSQSYKWSGAFNTADVPLHAGEGVAVLANPRNTSWTTDMDLLFPFPKKNAFYNYYDKNTGEPYDQTGTLGREKAGRFIYEDENDGAAADSSISVTLRSAAAGQHALLGNPFMAQLDFSEFAKANAGKIAAQYKLAWGKNSGKFNDLVSYVFNADGTLTASDGSNDADMRYIPPMQSVIVVPAAAGDISLKFDIDQHTAEISSLAGSSHRLRSKAAGRQAARVLIQLTRQGEDTSSCMLVCDEDAAGTFNVREGDSEKLFPAALSNYAMVYTLSSDGSALDINRTNDLSVRTPIGFCSGGAGSMTLHLSGYEGFQGSLCFYDDYEQLMIPLTGSGFTYQFEKTAGQHYINDRFFLMASGSGTATGGLEAAFGSDVIISASSGTLQVNTYNRTRIHGIAVSSLSGKTIINEQKLDASGYTSVRLKPGVYIVSVRTASGVISKKVVIP